MRRKIVTSILMAMLLLLTTVAIVSGNEPEIRSCVVAETLDAASYLYIRCKERGTDIWVATMRTSLRNGEQISFVDTPPMVNFTNKELKRTFAQVMFVTEIGRNGARPVIKSAPEPKGYVKVPPYEEEPLYTGTDDSGTLVFTDDPSKMASKSVPAKRRFRPGQNLTIQENYDVSEQQLLEPNAACLQEMRSLYDKNYQNLEICCDIAESNLKQKMSPECLKPYETKKFDYSEACQQEIKKIARGSSIEIKICIQDRFYSNLSSKCKKEKDAYQKSKAACAEISKKIENICVGKLECYEEHESEREAVCSGLDKQIGNTP